MSGILALGRHNPYKSVRLYERKITPTVGWRAVNISNKPAILLYSCEPPTALISMRFFLFARMCMRGMCILFCMLITIPASAKMASVGYVAQSIETATESKVDTSPTANQTMAGNYTVSGTLVVPTPPLPSAK